MVCDFIVLGIINNFPARVDTFRHHNHVSIPYRSDFSPTLKLRLQLQVRNPEHEGPYSEESLDQPIIIVHEVNFRLKFNGFIISERHLKRFALMMVCRKIFKQGAYKRRNFTLDNCARGVTTVDNCTSGVTTVDNCASGVTAVDNCASGVTTVDNCASDVTTVDNCASAVTTVENCASAVTTVENCASGVTE